MKKTFFNALMLSLSLLALGSSCSDGEETEALPVLEVETQTMNFETKASSQEIQITTNIPDLKVQVDKDATDWCSAIIDGDKLVVSVLENHNKDVRSTTVIVYRKAKSRKITVSQLGNGLAILVDPKLFKLESGDETEIKFKVTTNVEGLEIASPSWVVVPEIHPDDKTRAAAMIDHEYTYTVEGNITTEKRRGAIVVSAVDPELNLKVEIPIEQAGLPEYDPSGSEDLAEDKKITPDRGWASSSNGDKTIEGSFDGSITNGKRWHCALNAPCPHTIIYYFNNPVALDYIKYYSRQDGNANGYFGKTEILYSDDPNADENSQYTHITDRDFDGQKYKEGERVNFPQTVTAYAIKFIISTGKGNGGSYKDNLVACEEIEFYQKDTNTFDWQILFTDETCSELKPEAQSEEYIKNNCPFDFYKNLALHLFKGTYDRPEFRIQTYKAYPHPDIQAATNKTNPYSLLDNPTGIAVDDKESLIVFVGDMHGQGIKLKVQNLDKDGKDGFGGDVYPLVNGYNKLRISNKGLVYVMYHTSTLEEAETALPVKIHFASGKVNGYFDSNKHTDADWSTLVNKATNKHFDVLGRYAHLTFETQYFKTTTKDLIDLYDEIVYEEMKFMGLEKYDRMFRNRMYLNVMYKDYMYATSYHTAYNNSTMGEIGSTASLKLNVWGPAHEIGHCNQTRPGLKWLSTTEVTNNICAMHVQTLFSEKYDSELRLRDENLSGTGFTNRYEKAMTRTFTTSQALVAESDPFCRLVPFWQLELYLNKVLGQTDYYKDLYELLRTEDDIESVGGNQIEFVRRASQIAKLDLAEFFTKWGFLTSVDREVKDYATGWMKITQTDADAIRAKTSVYSKPAHNIQYICEHNIEAYQKDAAIQRGTATRAGNKITMTGWQNVVAYEVYKGDKLVFVSPMQSFTVSTDLATLDGTTKVYAIPAKGNNKVEVTF